MRALILILLTLVMPSRAEEPKDFRGAQFIGFDKVEQFQQSKSGAQVVLTSRVTPALRWDELVISWNFRAAPTNGLKIEARGIYPTRETKWYEIASWALVPTMKENRTSRRGQKDEDGTVDTDTLKLKEPATSVEIRITLDPGISPDSLKFLGLAFSDSKAAPPPLQSNRSVWGKMLKVKERSQANYPEGISEWCSPTSMSMLMSYWSTNLQRADLDYDVPAVARGVLDPGWPGTGNWPFNTAFAGAHSGVRSYVARFSDVTELEDWIAAGIPIAVSVAYGYLKGQPERANGHLVVCIGFDENGNIVVNDPGRRMVRQVYQRENLIKAWAESENSVYIVHPENWEVPADRFGHWFPSRRP